MKKKLNKNRGIALLLAVVILFTTILLPASPAGATTMKYITASRFIEELVKGIKLQTNSEDGDRYVNAIKTAGILKDEDGIDLDKYITRADAAVLLNRADEYLHGDKVDSELLKVVIKKRISDIKKIAKDKREAVAKVYAKGIIKGYGNGYYIQNRSFRGSDYMTSSTAKSFIKLVVNSKKRAKISPDGQLIRTTNLPKNAKKYEYILASFPNKFYERKFEFMFSDQYKAGRRCPQEEGYPIQMKKWKFKNWYKEWNFSIEMKKYLNNWTDLAEKYFKYLFNVDYRTVDSKWINGLTSVYVKSNCNEAEDIKNYYIKQMKSNKVKVESSIIAVEPSTLYYDGDYCMRAYVRYRITAKNINTDQSQLIYCQNPFLENLKNGEWREGIFDIRFGSNNGSSGDGSDWAISIMSYFADSFNESVK